MSIQYDMKPSVKIMTEKKTGVQSNEQRLVMIGAVMKSDFI